ncbi:carboxylesterase/lipase family protein [Mycolicibacter arupensis]|uniref:Carboxylic ester hydrolase n=1 Tax=Mycolicibacter arupensis TaxID=342002 RepID=A0A0F5MWL4_9MYCO|nr:carboxylesterase/lipase family protein [Mycolicibacter arupensis]KKB99183.1 carboxylesterase [Mycolicibacter arupensis]MCV7275263.1 carboxylesterase/lipase family protein [Mycolicibacter arupensis]ORA00387.1 carboxylesterase [Mycolicibacter arupensis]
MHKNPVQATITSGIVEGFARDGVRRWRSIPYARPPVGPLRFRAPQPAEPWSGVRHCHGFTQCAPQERYYTLLAPGRFQPTSEDCLTLNVTAPEDTETGPLPVMVFIHGGGYIMGSSATPIYDGAALARRGCVFVSMNYRLGALGCLDLSSLSNADVTLDSNLYLRDLVLALRWVRENIATFGGDPDNVTIFGESAGAHAVATLLAVPAAEGLFTRAIAESPAAGLVRNNEIAAAFAERFAALLGVRPSDSARALLRVSTSELLAAQDRLIAEGNRDMLGAFPIGPVCGDDVLPVDPVEAMRTGSAHRVPLIVGSNADEGRLFTRFLRMLPVDEPSVEAVLAGAGDGVRDRIIAAYPDYPKRSACIRLGGDFAFNAAVWQIAEAHGAHAPTYVYRYDYAPRMLRWAGMGATHATELFAVFDVYRNGGFGRLLTAGADRRTALQVSKHVQRRWGAFGRTGAPGDGWPAYTAGERAVMVFDRRSRLEYDPAPERRKAWQGFTLAR